MLRIKTDYKKRQNDLLFTSECVIQNILEHEEVFQEPPPAFANLQKTVPAFRKAMAAALFGDKYHVAVKDDLKAEVTGYMQELADYVTLIANGNRTIMLQSGFNVTAEERTMPLPERIDILEVKLGGAGQATTKVRNASVARAYMHQYTTELKGIDTLWISEGTALCSYSFNQLESGRRYWFRVIAIGSGTQKAYSPVVSAVIQ